MKGKRTVRCLFDYEEDRNQYWTAGCEYAATKHRDGTWSIITNYGNVGKVGSHYLLNDFDEYFVEVKN